MAGSNNALISVASKPGIIDFAEGLHELDWAIYASGGTARQISRAGIPVTDVAEIVGGDTILQHRVDPLSKEIRAGLLAAGSLANESNDMDIKILEKFGIPLLGLVCVDMYPLRAAINSGSNESEVTEKTDIGGPTMLRSAAKGRCIVLSQPQQRVEVIKWLKAGRPDDENIRRTLAAIALQEAVNYDAQPAEYLGRLVMRQEPKSDFEATLRQGLRPQPAALQ